VTGTPTLTSVTVATGDGPDARRQSVGAVGEAVADAVVVADGVAVADAETLALGVTAVEDAAGVGDEVAATRPVQVTPLSEKLAGTGLLEPFQVPLNPNVAVPFVAIVPFHGALVTVTAAPLCLADAFHA
jgi:hypothetical protein